MKREICDFILKADWEGGYGEVVNQWPDLVPDDALLKNYSQEWVLAEERFRQRLRELAEEHDVDIDNPYLYDEDEYED